MATLQTERLLLRPFHKSDVDDFYEYSKNKHVGPNAGWKPHANKAESAEIMREIFLDQESVWAIVWQATEKVIGSIGIVDDAKRPHSQVKMLGYAIGEDYWGRGITTEASLAVLQYAFLELGLGLVSIYCYPFNKRSMRVIEKCGFHYEGQLRQAERIYDGNIYDTVCYSMTRNEYLEKYGK